MRKKTFKYYLHFNDGTKVVDNTSLSLKDIKTMYTSNFDKSLHILLHKRLSKSEQDRMSWYFVGDTDGNGIVVEPVSRETHGFFKNHIANKQFFKSINDKCFMN